MALAGYLARVAITATNVAPTTADLVNPTMSTGMNRTAAELDNSYLGNAYTSFILGKRGAEVPLEGDYDAADVAQARVIAAFESGASIWVHVLFDGTTGQRVEARCSGYNIGADQGGKVTFSATIKSVGAVQASTLA
ncbi:hypothetical protein [Myxococcus virescens]|uniref:Phage tail protein n=1 Tax=Myxococcus virescens TaxID=83456 RepID=A0A511HRT8_9BACT|nr:hypothetical protein [Myxococcus virescens]GEL75209.1 hypothetical protein MVI01_69930 [Myxococcus virescens]SDD65291.1 hypothetical protein SAMN04488504_102134 [Myxococcus virescens]